MKLECENDKNDQKMCYLRAINPFTNQEVVRFPFHVKTDIVDACTRLRVIMSTDVNEDQLPIRVKYLIHDEPLTYQQANKQIYWVFHELGYESSPLPESQDSQDSDMESGHDVRPKPAASSKAIAKAKASGGVPAASSKAIAKAKASGRVPAASSKTIAKAKASARTVLKKPAGKRGA